MYQQTLPRATKAYANLLLREQARLELRLKRSFRRVDDSFAPIAALLASTIAASQARVAEAGMAYTEELLGGFLEGVGDASVAPLVGVTGAGVPVEEVFAGSRIMSTPQALQLGYAWALQLAKTALSDTGRQSVALGMGTRRCGGYMRALVGKTCARCAVLAGALYWSEQAFQRHPQCDCQHIPYRDTPNEKYLVNGTEYFESLSEAEQDSVFGKAGAEAIRNGADLNQVVNARRGMKRAQVFGKDLLVTSEGMTRRGLAYSRLRDRRLGDVKLPGQRYAQARAPRMMPESIREVAGTNQTLYLDLLKRHGYII